MSTFRGYSNIPKRMQRVLHEWNLQEALQLEMVELLELRDSYPLDGKLGQIYPEAILYPAAQLDHGLSPTSFIPDSHS